tara:strand:- start:26 stop:862 length:837 start_codon:yes stop_codon:yes gene_type:complete
MDIIVKNRRHVIYNKSWDDAKLIFIKTEMITFFIDNLMNSINQTVNIVIGNADITFPNNIDKRFGVGQIPKKLLEKLINNPFINKIFVENLDSYLPKTYPIPLGINTNESPANLTYFEEFYNINIDKPLKFTNFNRNRNGKGQWEERGDVLKLCNTAWSEYYINTKPQKHNTYLKKMGENLFTICVHGGGLDVNPKLWEALLIGVIPIIRENKPYTNIYTENDLPVVIVKEWSNNTITHDNLLKWKNKYYNYFTNKEKRNKMLEILSLDYWVKYISAI